MNPTLLHLPLRGHLNGRDRTGIVAATAVGPVRFTADGYYAEEGTTNFITVPRSPFSFTYAHVSIEQNRLETIPHLNGLATLDRYTRVTITGAAASNALIGMSIVFGSPPALGSPLSGQIMFRGSPGLVGKQMTWMTSESGGATAQDHHTETQQVIVITGEWQHAAFPGATFGAGDRVNAFIYGQILRTEQTIGEYVDICAAQLEQKAYCTSYCDGALGTGYSWAGTAHASASTRQGSALVIDPAGRITLIRGEAHIRVAYGPSGETAQYALHHINGTNTRLFLHRVLATKKLGIGLGSNGNFATEPGLTADGAAIVHGLSWDGTAAIHYKDLAAANTGSVGTGLQTFTSELGIGGLASGGQQVNGVVSDLMIFDRPLTNAERATLAAAPAWSFGLFARDPVPGLLLPV